MTTGERPKAYSYVRFSTPEQAKGRSYERQMELAQAYAKEHGLELAETTYKDLGVSAFRGKNAQMGALRTFLKAVEEGDIPSGSYLLVEGLDRLTRNSILAAQGLLMLIIEAGITLVTLGSDKRVYSRESVTGTDLILSIVIMMRANEESVNKAKNVTDAYAKKREQAAAGTATKPFNTPPAWLHWDAEARAYAVAPERASVLRSIFKKTEAGWGQHRITQWLNEKNTPTWGKGERWGRTYVRKLLTNSAVVGTFTPHQKQTDAASGKQTRKPLDGIANYFPPVIDRELFERVASRLKITGAPRGRNASAEPVSIFAGVLKCANCGGAVTRIVKDAKYPYLVCSKASSKGECRYLAVPYRDVEQAFRDNAKAIIQDAPRAAGTEKMERDIANLDAVVGVLFEEGRSLTGEIAMETDDTVKEMLRARLRERAAEHKAAQARLRTLREQKDARARPFVLRRLKALRETLLAKTFNVSAVNLALKEAVSKIILDPEAGRLTIFWHHAPEQPTGDVPFASRHSRAFETPTDGAAA